MKSFLRYHIKDRIALMLKNGYLSLSSETPILVLTMAKVGSLSVYSSIKTSSKIPIFHIHSLDIEHVKQTDQLCFDAGTFPDAMSPIPLVVKKIIETNNPYKVISLFRDPVERNLSAFFDAFKMYVGVNAQEYKGSLKELIDIYHDELPHTYPIDWYDNHFAPGTGIDVYNFDFDTEKQYSVFKNGNVDVLLMNSQLNDVIKQQVIGGFVGLQGFQLNNTNVTSKSSANQLYSDFKNNIRFEKEYLSSLLDTQYARHFFNSKTRDAIMNRWLV